MDQTKNMTEGAALSQMVAFAIPVFAGMLCQRLYNFADIYIVGAFLGDEALASVSIAGTATYLMFSLVIGVTTGISVVVSQVFGSGEHERLNKTFVAGTHVALLTTAAITLVGMLTAKPLLHLMQTTDELFADAYVYLQIIYAGCIATMLYNSMASVLRAVGNSAVPFFFVVFSSFLNIGLDLLFVAVIPMGTAGAALATVVAQLISGILCYVYAYRILPFIRIHRGELGPDILLVREIFRYGIPTALQMSIISVSDVILQSVVNTFGIFATLAYGVCIKVEGLGWQLADGIGASVTAFTGQNIGAGNLKRVRTGVRCSYIMNLIAFGVFCPAIFLGAPLIMKAFTETPEAIAMGVKYMHIFAPCFIFGGLLTVFYNLLRASGDVTATVFLGIAEVVMRAGGAFVLPRFFGVDGLWFVSPATWIVSALCGMARYYSGAWETRERLL